MVQINRRILDLFAQAFCGGTVGVGLGLGQGSEGLGLGLYIYIYQLCEYD